jgi:hypothetical protein
MCQCTIKGRGLANCTLTQVIPDSSLGSRKSAVLTRGISCQLFQENVGILLEVVSTLFSPTNC